MNRTGLWLLAFACVISGWWLGSLTQYAGRVTEPVSDVRLPRALEPFELTDHRRQSFGRQQLLGQWTLVYLGYISCPDVCPITLQELTQLERNLDAQQFAQPLQVLFVSIDPGRDSLDRINDYLAFFSRNFIGATASVDELSRFAEQLDLAFIPPGDPSTDNYLVEHAASLAVINPNGELQALIEAPHYAVLLETRLRSILRDFSDRNQESG